MGEHGFAFDRLTSLVRLVVQQHCLGLAPSELTECKTV